jgi:Uma2 family endonuclease
MATATAERVRTFGPGSAGIQMTTREFDRAEFEEGARYELINGVLIVSPIPSENERDCNGELDYLLRLYRDAHPQGSCMNRTLAEQTVKTKHNRRRADRVIWASLGRRPRKEENPSIVAEFVSEGKRDRDRDYKDKRDEYIEIGVDKYWIIDRFKRTMTVYSWQGGKLRKRVLQENQIYTTPLLPGFELPLAKLFAQVQDGGNDE